MIYMADIRINLSNVRRQINQLRDAQTIVQREMQKIQSLKTLLSQNWQGNASVFFMSKLDEQYVQLFDLSKRLDTVANTIESVAERIRREEEALIQASQNL